MLRRRNGIADILLKFQKWPSVSRELHLVENGIDKLPEHAWLECGGELQPHIFLAGHRFRRDEIRTLDARPFSRFIAKCFPAFLRAQPERKGGDLDCAGVNVDAVQVVFDDCLWDCPL